MREHKANPHFTASKCNLFPIKKAWSASISFFFVVVPALKLHHHYAKYHNNHAGVLNLSCNFFTKLNVGKYVLVFVSTPEQ